jgi:hypothetical protein
VLRQSAQQAISSSFVAELDVAPQPQPDEANSYHAEGTEWRKLPSSEEEQFRKIDNQGNDL